MRTAAMMIVTAGCAAMAAGWAYFLIGLVHPASETALASFLIPLSVTFIGIFGVLGALSASWTGARSRSGSGSPLPWRRPRAKSSRQPHDSPDSSSRAAAFVHA